MGLNLALALLSISLTIAVLELSLQLAPRILPASKEYGARALYERNARDLLSFWHRDELARNTTPFAHHPRYGWIGRPNVNGRNWAPDGAFEFSTNSQGFRDRDHELENARGRVRIAVLGDSFIWGLPLDQDELMPQVLERELSRQAVDAEVFNFGITGYGNDQELLILEDQALRYLPDLVILSFFYSNDFDDNSTAIAPSGEAKPFFRLNDRGELELRGVPAPTEDTRSPATSPGDASNGRPSLIDTLKQALSRRMFLYHLTIDAVRSIPLVEHVLTRTGLASRTIETVERAKASQAARAQELTAAIIRRMRQRVEASGARFLVMVFPGYGYSYSQQQPYDSALRFFSTALPEIDVLGLAPAYEHEDAPTYTAYSDHWNAAGARVAAREVSAYLLSKRDTLLTTKRR